jgi:hypothetical protein
VVSGKLKSLNLKLLYDKMLKMNKDALIGKNRMPLKKEQADEGLTFFHDYCNNNG